MTDMFQVNKVKIIYFSGTGNTAMVAEEFEREFIRRAIPVVMSEISAGNFPSVDDDDLLILMFPVHAFNAPEIVYEWIETINAHDPISAVVISVSAGGSTKPNMACRLSSIRGLERKNCHVYYEEMLVMPSNLVVQTPVGLAIRMLEILPSKVRGIVDDILSGTQLRTDPPLPACILSRTGELEKRGAKLFGKKIRVKNNCKGCGWCERNCPSNNIIMSNGKPLFNGTCLLCLKCFYGCPEKALEPGILKFFVLKDGYDLKSLKKRMEGDKPEPVEELAKGYLWKGVRDYLSE
ncbi:MAG: EFR1 family ferrodoxin [Methanolobus sp.]|nr:EFR1 family ferrodoxin [Methanolobus sp.]